jgi:hypothetical protein
MLLEYIEYVRTLPAPQRRKRALIYAGLITALIVAIWLSVLYFGNSSYLNPSNKSADSAQQAAKKNSMIALPSFGDAVDGFIEQTQHPKSAVVGGTDTPPPQLAPPAQQAYPYSPGSINGVTGGVGSSSPPQETQLPQQQPRASSTATSSEDTMFVESLLQETKP